MLLVRTVVKPSTIAGMGIFADEDIKKGQAIWRYSPDTCQLITQKQFHAFVNSFHKTEQLIIQYYLTYGYYVAAADGVLILLDNARFFNHSNEPNSGGCPEASGSLGDQCSVALRDIKKGEELTESYQTYDSSVWLESLCQRYGIHHTHD
ncbi:SET domain protein [Candidatus Protochlamydia naegleriophila]|uniref:SET domain protein n=1 Tax=Candidatus Protochlamydia naegleriophila TaxID=389348 RepID=A0A0U5EU86_9BACT|nr:SET domain-containing protein [Candidatus Protochlamydia naegleriophila]CUI17761.1 SET domain protein [Candidatus Protochlamydia naegleriophila]